MQNNRMKILVLLIFVSISAFTACFALSWADKVSPETIADSLGTWNNHFSNEEKKLTTEDFSCAVEDGVYKELSVEDFLQLNVENQRLSRYCNAQSAEEFYPLDDRPRGLKDLESVNYLVQTDTPVSPIIVARVHDGNNVRYIKLDGVHRLIAASIKKCNVRILFIDF